MKGGRILTVTCMILSLTLFIKVAMSDGLTSVISAIVGGIFFLSAVVSINAELIVSAIKDSKK